MILIHGAQRSVMPEILMEKNVIVHTEKNSQFASLNH